MPGCWLKKGRNEVIVLDVIGPAGKAVCSGRAEPELDKLNITSPATHRKPGETLDTKALPLAAQGSFAPGNGWQTVRLGAPAKGRYVAIEGLNAHDGKQLAAIAELYVLDAQGKRLSREPWTIRYADSEDVAGGNYMADKVFDLQESTYWQTDRRPPPSLAWWLRPPARQAMQLRPAKHLFRGAHRIIQALLHAMKPFVIN